MMKPKAQTEHDTGMLEFLEDIIGTSRFKVPIEQLSQKVEEYNEMRVEKLNRVKLVEKEKDDLEPAMLAALDYIRMENEKTEKVYRQRRKYIHEAEINIVKSEEKKKEIEESVSDLTEKLQEITGKRKEKEGEILEKGKSFDAVQEEIEILGNKFKKLELEDTGLREDLKHTNARRKKIKAQMELEKEKKEKLENLPEENTRKIEECVELREKLEKKLVEEENKYETAMASLREDTEVHQEEKAKHESKLVGLKKDVNEAASELDLATNEHAVYTSAEVKEKNRLEDLFSRIESTKESVKEKAAKLSELEETIPAKEQELQEAETEFQQVSQDMEKANSKLHTMRMDYGEKKSSQQATKSHGQVHDALMQQKRNGNIPGIIGRLGDLGGIDKKYDCAISTACGGLDTILVEDMDTGTKCIEFLKRNNIGRANFYALNQAKHFAKRMQPLATPQNVPRLFDLITVAEERYRPGFYRYLQDTLVADNIDIARKAAYGAKRFRVVTLAGEVIETSGTLSGGGRKVTGKMGQQSAVKDKISPVEFEKMENSISEMEGKMKEMVTRKQQLDDFIFTTKKEILEMKKQLGKLRVEVNPLREQVVMLERQVSTQQEKVKEAAPDKNKVKEMMERINAAQKVYDVANEKAEVVEKDVKACDAKIKEITGGKIKSVQKKLEDTKNQLNKVKAEITKLEVEIKTSERNLKKCLDKIKDSEEEVKECEEKMKEIQGRRKEIEKLGQVVIGENDGKQEESGELQEAIKKLKIETEKITKEETALKSSRIEVDQELKKWDDAIRDNNKKVKFWKNEVRKLQLQDIPGEPMPVLPELTEEDVAAINMDDLTYELNQIDENLAKTKPNMAAINDFKKKEEVRSCPFVLK